MGELNRRAGRYPGWVYTEEMTTGGESEPISIPPLDGIPVSVTLITETGSGKIQFSTSPDDEVAAGSAEWTDWPLGLCTETKSDAVISPISGLKLIRTSGTVGIEIII